MRFTTTIGLSSCWLWDLAATHIGDCEMVIFSCHVCQTSLSAEEGQEAQCPTCGNNITIPILDRYGRLIDPKTNQIIKQDPHPVHAYAAAGDRAPQILKNTAGQQNIRCPRCAALSPVSANNCKACG